MNGLSKKGLVRFSVFLLLGFFLTGMCGVLLFSQPAAAAEKIRLSCSAQVYEAFKGQTLSNFTKQTGIKVQVDRLSSHAAVSRLSNRMSDLAATAEDLHPRYKAEGMIEIPFCRDALVIITHIQNPVRSLTLTQLRGLFSGVITNWKDIGGPDLKVRVISPDRGTAAFNMFTSQVMRGGHINYYLLTAESTAAGDATRRYKGSISYVNQAAVRGKPGATRILKVDGLGPADAKYPYYETFSLVTSGQPEGMVKKFVDYVFSAEAQKIISSLGMKPLNRP
jgi:phosphate transport system substrate-binding protein